MPEPTTPAASTPSAQPAAPTQTPSTPAAPATPPAGGQPSGQPAAAQQGQPGAAPAQTPGQPSGQPPEPPKRDPIAATLAEINRKEASFRADKKKWDDERKEIAAKEAARAEREAVWKVDPLALLEDNGWKVEDAIDVISKGGGNSPEAQIRAMRLEREQEKKKAAEDAAKRAADEEAAAKKKAGDEAVAMVTSEAKKLLADDRFELLRAEGELLAEGGGDPIELEVAKHIANRWMRDQANLTVEQAMLELEDVLDRRGMKLAQSNKLKARLSPKPADGQKEAGAKPDAQRQDTSVPTATQKRTITIKQRTQAVAPIRFAREGGASRDEIRGQVSANLASLFQSK